MLWSLSADRGWVVCQGPGVLRVRTFFLPPALSSSCTLSEYNLCFLEQAVAFLSPTPGGQVCVTPSLSAGESRVQRVRPGGQGEPWPGGRDAGSAGDPWALEGGLQAVPGSPSDTRPHLFIRLPCLHPVLATVAAPLAGAALQFPPATSLPNNHRAGGGHTRRDAGRGLEGWVPLKQPQRRWWPHAEG